jgi:hypothetical protein
VRAEDHTVEVETYLGKRVDTGMNDPLGLGENIIKCGVNITVVYLRY